ncbi:MAG TPA: hypothetical protein VFA18_17660, partial [Gemmataceae bacterium]|nr:hypothetical protein [Gemmataceae bacterium]
MSVTQFEDRITPSGPSITTLTSFGSSNGTQPVSGLTMDNSGNLYGTILGAAISGNNYVYEWDRASGMITDLAPIASGDGMPVGALVMDTSGDLYGTTNYVFALDNSIVFEWPKGSPNVGTVAQFTSSNGASSNA